MTPWSTEDLLVWHHLRRPLDGHTFTIERAVIFKDPVFLQKGAQKDASGGLNFRALPCGWDAQRVVGRVAGASTEHGPWRAGGTRIHLCPATVALAVVALRGVKKLGKDV